MVRFTFVLLFLFILTGYGPALALDPVQTCNPKSWEDRETHTYNGVTCQIKLQMVQTESCDASATSFQVDLEDYWTKKKTSVTCDGKTPIFMGNQYTCRWNSQVEKFNWLEFGTRGQTCQILVNWVQKKPD